MTFCLPADPSRRFPQSVQKTRLPIADIVGDLLICRFKAGDSEVGVGVQEKSYGESRLPRLQPS
jgi:hypothetical protein